ncbi:MAG: TlpA family protein disulfide reductase [Kofleriaceae bacterium]
MSQTSTSTKALIGALLAGSVGVIIFLFVHLSGDPSKPVSIGTQKAAACTKGEKCMPDVRFIDTNGTAYTYEQLRGKVVVVNFWATWCKPCQKEIPAFSKVYDRYKSRGVVFLGVLTGDQASSDELLNFASDNMMSYPIVRETSDIRMSFIDDMDNLPTTLIFDRGGKQVYGRAGGLSEARLSELLEPLVAQK